jgi:lipoyl(octanoyl) transferase
MSGPRALWLGRVPYEPVFAAMRAFAEAAPGSADELWCLEHPPIYTQGLAGRSEHVLDPRDIPVLRVDRGGQVTYHGPGQLVLYPLLDLARLGLGVRALVTALEAAMIGVLAAEGVEARARRDAPGVYVGEAKLASIGLRIRRGRCYHGLALNVDMDLEPFTRINPCGYAGLAVTDLRRLGLARDTKSVAIRLVRELWRTLGLPGHAPEVLTDASLA